MFLESTNTPDMDVLVIMNGEIVTFFVTYQLHFLNNLFRKKKKISTDEIGEKKRRTYYIKQKIISIYIFFFFVFAVR
jgi:hypothetical protein